MSLARCPNGHVYNSRRYGKVCPYCSMKLEEEEPARKAAGFEPPVEILDEAVRPVCGWIVCISGARQGKGYEIKSGKNFVGRADDMDIQILGDNKISRRNHGVIVFDPKKKETVLLPGDSNGLVYHNDAAVYTPTVLNSYDVIEMGDSKFVFVPFCGENFMWEDNQAPSGGSV